MREVDDSPNRCPVCQRVQMTPFICNSCDVKAIMAQDIIDLLDVIYASVTTDHRLAANMILTMRKAMSNRIKPEGGVYATSTNLENSPESPSRDSGD